jgi:hypothetical protein
MVPPTRSRADRLAEVALVAVTILPIVVAAVRAWREHWYPIGDDAYFSLRSRDVLTRHHPWLGTWTSASRDAGIQLNNPGPLLFDILALPAKLSAARGPMVGAAALAAACAGGSVVLARRVAGWVGALAIAASTTSLVWAMGSSVIVEPWQPHALMLPFGLFLVAAWSVAAGDAPMAVVLVAVASLLVQTHLPYAPLVAVVGGVSLILHLRSGAWASERDRSRGWLVGALLVAVVLWAQPILEQIGGPGQGNLSRVAEATISPEEDTPSIGPTGAVRVVATLVAPIPQWGRADFADLLLHRPAQATDDDALSGLVGVPSAGGAAWRLLPLIAVGGLAAVVAHRRREGEWETAVAVAAAGLVGGLTTVALLPENAQYVLAVHQVRWLWPLAAFVTAVVLGALVGRRAARALQAAVAGLVVIVAVASIPSHRQPVGPIVDDWSMAPMRAIAAQLAEADVDGPVLFAEERLRPFEPYSAAVVLELERNGVDVVFDDDGFVRQMGPAREADGTETHQVLVVEGRDPVLPAGAEVIARVDGLSTDGEQALADARRQVERRLEAGDVRLTELGRAAADRGLIDASVVEPSDERSSGDLAALVGPVRAGYVELGDGAGGALLDRWAALELLGTRGTVTVAVAPLP